MLSSPYFLLALAIIAEVVATTALKKSEGFTQLLPSIVVAVGYILAFYFLSQILDRVPVGIAYAIWSGVGIVLVTILGYFIYDQKLDVPAMVGIGFIILGVVVINAYSKSVAH